MPARTGSQALQAIRRTLDLRRHERQRDAWVRLLVAARITSEAYADWRDTPSEFTWTLYQGALVVEEYWNHECIREAA